MQLDLLVIGLEILLSISGVLLLILLVNLCTFHRLHNGPTQSPMPLLSILVPARNEEQCIEDCIHSLVTQDYERLEVLVLDDKSTDATVAIVEHLLAELPELQKGRLRLLHGENLPQGWVGKNFACHQLAQQAHGNYLLFTDADTVHKPGMARAVIDCMHQLNVQLLTAQPEHLMESPAERLVVPLLNFTILTLLPVALILKRPEPSLATGNGQLLCFERRAYEKIGAHGSVKEYILEDVLLARALKTAGFRMIFVDAQELVHCRMYHSFAEVWAGFSRESFCPLQLLAPPCIVRTCTQSGTICAAPIASADRTIYSTIVRDDIFSARCLLASNCDANSTYIALHTCSERADAAALSTPPDLYSAGMLDLAQLDTLALSQGRNKLEGALLFITSLQAPVYACFSQSIQPANNQPKPPVQLQYNNHVSDQPDQT